MLVSAYTFINRNKSRSIPFQRNVPPLAITIPPNVPLVHSSLSLLVLLRLVGLILLSIRRGGRIERLEWVLA